MASSSWISQEYFDELCIENKETFDMSETEAVNETLEQLRQQQKGQQTFDHLIVTYPNASCPLRRKRKLLQSAIHSMKSNQSIETLLGSLVGNRHDENEQRILSWLFTTENGFDQCWKAMEDELLQEESDESSNIRNLLRIMVSMLSNDGGGSSSALRVRSSLQQTMPTYMKAWLRLYQQSSSNQETRCDLLDIAKASCRQCEYNKQAWLAQPNTDETGIPELLIQTLKDSSLSATLLPTAQRVCQLIVVLCTFDDFSNKNSVKQFGYTIQSSHTAVQRLANAVPALQALLLQTPQDPSLLSACRALAIQQDVIESMVSVGMLNTVLQSSVVVQTQQSPETSTAWIGLLRNWAAQDDVKRKLCDTQTLSALQHAMQTFADHGLLQEHACGLLAALALREADHAERIVSAHLHECILTAVRKHPTRVTLQRQAALAIRNLVSRSAVARQALQDGGAVSALQEVSAQHAACQDEVYAALRDLGVSVRLLHVKTDETSGETVVQPTDEFGVTNVNFRPVYD